MANTEEEKGRYKTECSNTTLSKDTKGNEVCFKQLQDTSDEYADFNWKPTRYHKPDKHVPAVGCLPLR